MSEAIRLSALAASDPRFVTISLRGQIFSVSKDTIMKFPNTLLAKMLSVHNRVPGVPKAAKGDDVIHIDRDGNLFHYILNWYRDGKIFLYPNAKVNEIKQEM